jgi:hypothetical protein
MTDTDGAGARHRLGVPAELLLLDRPPRAARVVAAALGVGLAAAWGFAALLLHEHELNVQQAGNALNPLGLLFAGASSPLTAWPGWAVAAIVGLSAFRMRGGTVEAPTGRRSVRELSTEELRSGLRQEYVGVRLGLVALALLTLADLSRLAVSGIAALLDVAGAGDGLAWMGAEVAGLMAATAALAIWVLSFREQLNRVGALPLSPAATPPEPAP